MDILTGHDLSFFLPNWMVVMVLCIVSTVIAIFIRFGIREFVKIIIVFFALVAVIWGIDKVDNEFIAQDRIRVVRENCPTYEKNYGEFLKFARGESDIFPDCPGERTK